MLNFVCVYKIEQTGNYITLDQMLLPLSCVYELMYSEKLGL